jgi:hypothetical protein
MEAAFEKDLRRWASLGVEVAPVTLRTAVRLARRREAMAHDCWGGQSLELGSAGGGVGEEGVSAESEMLQRMDALAVAEGMGAGRALEEWDTLDADASEDWMSMSQEDLERMMRSKAADGDDGTQWGTEGKEQDKVCSLYHS